MIGIYKCIYINIYKNIFKTMQFIIYNSLHYMRLNKEN